MFVAGIALVPILPAAVAVRQATPAAATACPAASEDEIAALARRFAE